MCSHVLLQAKSTTPFFFSSTTALSELSTGYRGPMTAFRRVFRSPWATCIHLLALNPYVTLMAEIFNC